MNREMFELYVETLLAPTLRPGDVIILDNLSSHKSPEAAAMMRTVGAWFFFSPPYVSVSDWQTWAVRRWSASIRWAICNT